MQTAINGKANASHTHSYLPLSGGTLTGGLTINQGLNVKGYLNGESVYYTTWKFRNSQYYQLYRFGRVVYTAGPVGIWSGWTSDDKVGTIPVGFRPVFPVVFAGCLVNTNKDLERILLQINQDGSVTSRTLTSSSSVGDREFLFSACWICQNELPS